VGAEDRGLRGEDTIVPASSPPLSRLRLAATCNTLQLKLLDLTSRAEALRQATWKVNSERPPEPQPAYAPQKIWVQPLLLGKIPLEEFLSAILGLYRSITRVMSPDEYIYEMYMGMPDGPEFKSLENRCLRKKS
jgi:hypothetical protein